MHISDLQLALVGLGAVIIVLVMLFNRWQERRLHRQLTANFETPDHDLLMDDLNSRIKKPVEQDFTINTDNFIDDEVNEEIEPVVVSRSIPASEPASSSTAQEPVAEPLAADLTKLDAQLQSIKLDLNAENLNAETDFANIDYDRRGLDDIKLELDPAELDAIANHQEEMALDTDPVQIEQAEPAISSVELASESIEPAAVAAASIETEPEVIASTPAAKPEPVSAPAELGPVAVATPMPSSDVLPEAINPQVDLSAVLYLPTPTTGAKLRQLLLTLTDLDKPYFAHAFDAQQIWQLLTREQENNLFQQAAYSLQLADRSGPVSVATLRRFQTAVESLAQQLGAKLEWLGDQRPLGFAQQLDQFCIEVDKMVGFNLLQGASGPFTGTKFRGLAEASGLALAEDGAFHFRNEQGQEQFTIVSLDANPFNVEMLRMVNLRGVKFQLDIPRVKNCAEVFNHMVLVARQMEGSLSAHLVDDHQRPLADAQIDKIRQQLKLIHAQLLTRNIVPGSPCALRLFS
jgi:ZipA, C-terminal FtsZ-binding domain